MDYSNPGPQTEYRGRRYTAEIEFFLPREASEDDVWNWLEFELGGGMMRTDHPLHGETVECLSVTNLRAERAWQYVDWSAEVDGRRTGRTRTEYTPPAQGTEARRAETGTGSVHDGPVTQ